ncbi:MAG: threonylcarbamoyl-AMP synthase [Clostridiales bacterium]|nr:threonylcarbamoyl-AMP synthase [Clostridiales bacterium]
MSVLVRQKPSTRPCEGTPASSTSVTQAAEILRRGGLVAIPTETVYGLGADAANRAAVEKIFEVKGRPPGHPLIVHLASAEHIGAWARGVPDEAWKLAEALWPGPLTLILKRAPRVLDVVTGGQDTIGLRVPGHPVAHALLVEFAGGIAAPSANRFGRISPTTAAHVIADLGDQVEMVLDAGPCPVGVESTILDLSEGVPRLLRPGSITAERISEILGITCDVPVTGGPQVPGQLESHYAPRTPLRLVDSSQLAATISKEVSAGHGVAVLAIGAQEQALLEGSTWFSMPADPESYAHDLYATLRELDRGRFRLILAEQPPDGPGWRAVRDRLSRAAAPSVSSATAKPGD